MFHRPSATPTFAMTVNVMAQPRGELADLETVVVESRKELERMKLTVDQLEIAERGDVAVVVGEYRGRIGAMQPMQFLAVAYLRGDQQVWVTATASAAQWSEHEDALRELMAGVRIAESR